MAAPGQAAAGRDRAAGWGQAVILIGLGSNLPSARYGAPRDIVTAALAALADQQVRILARSGWYRSAPVPPSDQPWYVNGVARVASERPAAALLALMQGIETRFGRVRSTPNAPRTLDLDLLDYHGQVIDTPFLVLPHPRLHERRFVLEPLAEVAPDWRHPRTGLGVAALLDGLDGTPRLERLSE